MVSDVAKTKSDLRHAFNAAEQKVRIRNYRIACILAFIFMPAGATLDWFVYPDKMSHFLTLRLSCSAALLFIWWLIKTPVGQKHYKALGLLLPALPGFFISWMIAETEGPASPYYAGLNLVLLGAGLILRWTLVDSVLVFLQTLLFYLAACAIHQWQLNPAELQLGTAFNNFYFLSVTGVFVVVGSYFYDRLRFQEFVLRHELDANRRQLEESHQKLLELDQAKSRFFANISHELRTPLTLLLAPLETLLNRYRPRLDAETLSLVQTMHGNGMRLLKLINDLLDIVRLESGRLEVRREPLDLPEFLRGLVSSARQMADDKRIRLETGVAPGLGVLLLDRDKLEKTLLNLIFNALKFTPAGGEVRVAAAREGDQLVLRVRDTGMGIAADKLPYVFSRFWQADDSSRRKYQGVGIGLSLVKEFTELQGGSVAVESQPGQGTTFTVRLPYLETAEAPRPDEAAPISVPAGSAAQPADGTVTVASQEWLSTLYRRAELFPAMTAVRDAIKPVETGLKSHQPKVLIADDEPDMLRFLASQLREHYQIIEAVDGHQAVEKATQFLPDLILTDMMMPEKDGMEVCRELRARPATQAIPVVLITARADEETKLAALAAGASDFLPKPFSTTELHVRVKNLVDSYDYQRKLARQNRQLEQTIEQLQETELQLVQTEKLASLGRLSAGIIHEINNPLNYAFTGLFTLKKKASLLSGRDRQDFDEVVLDLEKGLQRVQRIIGDLRGFSHQGSEQMDQVSLADAVAMTLRFLSHETRGRVHIETDIPRELRVWANKNKLTQVLINLIQNAIDAVLARREPQERGLIRITAEGLEGEVRLRMWDNGVGIPRENLPKIFDPFFTTKDVGKGMGLGLSICHRIMEQFGARITVDSEPGRFTEFCLSFPRRAAAFPPSSAPSSQEHHHVAAV
jgi:signal transduction histidine kinase